MAYNKWKFTDVLADDVNRTKTFLCMVVIFFVFISWLGVMDRAATEYVDEAIVQSTIAFASARAINAAVSVLQSSIISIPMIGGLSVGVGEVLDPINDLVEQYSSMMKLAIGSLVVQKVLLQVVSDTFFNILITLSSAALLAAVYLRQTLYINLFARVFLSFVFLRFLLAFVVFLNGAISKGFVDEYIEGDRGQLDQVIADIESLQANSNLTDEVRQSLNEDLAAQVDLQSTLERSVAELQAQLPSLQIAESGANEALEIISQARTLGERLNPFDSNEALDEARSVLRQSSDELNSHERLIQQSESDLESANEQVIYIENKLAGRPNNRREAIAQGFSNMSSRATTIGSNLNWNAVQNRLEQGVSAMLNLMAVFLLKTLMMPLLFLFLVLKVTKGIWGVDLRDLIQQGRDNISATIQANR